MREVPAGPTPPEASILRGELAADLQVTASAFFANAQHLDVEGMAIKGLVIASDPSSGLRFELEQRTHEPRVSAKTRGRIGVQSLARWARLGRAHAGSRERIDAPPIIVKWLAEDELGKDSLVIGGSDATARVHGWRVDHDTGLIQSIEGTALEAAVVPTTARLRTSVVIDPADEETFRQIEPAEQIRGQEAAAFWRMINPTITDILRRQPTHIADPNPEGPTKQLCYMAHTKIQDVTDGLPVRNLLVIDEYSQNGGSGRINLAFSIAFDDCQLEGVDPAALVGNHFLVYGVRDPSNKNNLSVTYMIADGPVEEGLHEGYHVKLTPKDRGRVKRAIERQLSPAADNLNYLEKTEE